jgi:hypothetical protein
MIKTLEYHFEDGISVIFDKYTIDMSGVIKNKKTGIELRLSKNKAGYQVVSVQDNYGKSRQIRICRAITSTFIGMPPTSAHTADHRDRDPNNDTLDNIRWLCKKHQVINRSISGNKKDAFIVVKDDLEKTVNDWVVYLKGEKNNLGREYTGKMIAKYAQKKQHGFSYKEYQNLQGEIWKDIANSKSTRGRWEISNMNRVKYITNHAENVLSEERLGLMSGYPMLYFNGKVWSCHQLAFMTFFPKEWAAKKPDEMVLHEDDDRMDFRPHKLRLGTHSDNTTDAHYNGKYDGSKSARMKCASYIEGVLEKEHTSQTDAMKYLKSIGYEKATVASISMTISGKQNTSYGRTWKLSS